MLRTFRGALERIVKGAAFLGAGAGILLCSGCATYNTGNERMDNAMDSHEVATGSKLMSGLAYASGNPLLGLAFGLFSGQADSEANMNANLAIMEEVRKQKENEEDNQDRTDYTLTPIVVLGTAWNDLNNNKKSEPNELYWSPAGGIVYDTNEVFSCLEIRNSGPDSSWRSELFFGNLSESNQLVKSFESKGDFGFAIYSPLSPGNYELKWYRDEKIIEKAKKNFNVLSSSTDIEKPLSSVDDYLKVSGVQK